jgi:hypothetical protein
MTHSIKTLYRVALCRLLKFIYCYAECRYDNCHHAECRNAECYGTILEHVVLDKISLALLFFVLLAWRRKKLSQIVFVVTSVRFHKTVFLHKKRKYLTTFK